jgi:hypothetical protein
MQVGSNIRIYIYIYIYICKLAAILERLADKKGTLHYQIIGYYV